MAIQWFLNHLNETFETGINRKIIQAYRQDPLVWKAIATIEHPEDWIALAGNSLFNWQVSKFALFTVRPELFNEDYRDLSIDLPEELQHKSERLLETIRTTGLEPGNLSDAIFLALALRNFRLEHDGWFELADFLGSVNKRAEIWETAFVILPAFVPDLEDAFIALIDNTEPESIDAITTLILHTVNTLFLDENQRYQLYTTLATDASIDFQLSLLKMLPNYETQAFIRLLASHLYDLNPESDETKSDFEKINLNRKRALLEQYAGLNDESAETIQSVQQDFQTLRASFLNQLAKDLEKTQAEEARKIWEEVLSLDPDNEHYISEYAEFLIYEGDVHQALYLLNTLSDRSIIKLYAWRYPAFAVILPESEYISDADLSSNLLSSPPSRFLASSDKFHAARVAFESKNYTLALEFINKALLENPNHLDSIKLASKINQHLANLQDAIQNLALLTFIENDNLEHKRELTQLYLQAHEPQKALDTFAEIINASTHPSRNDSLYYAQLAITAEQAEIAIPIARNFLAQDPLDGEAMVILAEAYLKSGRTDEARELLSQASALAPEKAASWLALARIWAILGENSSALSTLQKAQVAIPNDPQILTALGKFYLSQNQSSEAVSTLKQAIQLNPDNLEASIALTSALLKQGYIEDAWDTIQAFENDYSHNAQLALVLAETLAAKNERLRANNIFKFAWQSLRSNEALLAYIQNLVYQVEADDDASQAIKEDLRLLLPTLQDRNATYDASFEMKLLEADVKAKLGELNEAYEDYLYLLDLPEAKAPRFYQHLQRQIGLVALDLGYDDISMASLQEAISYNPNDLASRHALSHAYLKSGLNDKAIESAQTALELAPTDTHNVLWYSKFMQANHRIHDAIQALKDAIFRRPEEQILHLSLARVYLANNAVDESKITLSKMLETSDIPTEDYLHIAGLYARMNETQLAVDILQRAITENENPSFVESCQITYAFLEHQQNNIALNFLDHIKQKHGQQAGYAMLRADVLSTDKQYLSALEALEPLLRRLESGAIESIQSAFIPEENSGILPLDTEGLYLRVAYLNRLLANYEVAEKYAKLALKTNESSKNARVLSLDLALASCDKASLDQTLEELNRKESLNETELELAQRLALDALLEKDLTKASLIYEQFLTPVEEELIPMATKAIISEHEGQAHQAMAFIQVAKEGLSTTDNSGEKPLGLAEQFSKVWQSLALALVAWKLQDWSFANQLFSQATHICKSNPRLNLVFADYLADKARVQRTCLNLRVKRHLPQTLTSDRSDESVFDEQIALAKANLEPSLTQAIEIIGKAQFAGHLDDSSQLDARVKNSHIAKQAIAVLKDTVSISKILAMYPHDNELQFQYALQNIDKQADLACEILNSIPIKPNLQALHHAALALAQVSEPELAEDAINRALNIWQDEAEWFILRAEIQEKQVKLQDATQSVKLALELEPNNPGYWQYLGELALREGDLHTARNHYAKANSLKYNTIPVIEALADINRQLGDFPEAIAYYKELHILEPNNDSYLESLAELYFIIQDYDLALETADKVINRSLNCERALKVKIETLISRQAFDEAKKLANDAMLIAKDPITFEIYRIRIEARENPANGLRMATNLAHEHPDYPNVLNLLAQYQISLDQKQNAEKTLIRSLQLDKSNPETLLALGALNRQNNSHETAQTFLKQALELNPSLIEAYLELGQSLQDQRLNDQALQVYNKAIEQVSKDPRPYVHAANAYKASRDFRSAELMLKQASQLAPSDQSIRRQLAAVVAQNLLDNLQEAPKRK